VTDNPPVAGRLDRPASSWAGVWIAEDIELIARGVESRSWVDGSLGVVGAGLDGWRWCRIRWVRCCSTGSRG
jgi:hypothetical protein